MWLSHSAIAREQIPVLSNSLLRTGTNVLLSLLVYWWFCNVGYDCPWLSRLLRTTWDSVCLLKLIAIAWSDMNNSGVESNGTLWCHWYGLLWVWLSLLNPSFVLVCEDRYIMRTRVLQSTYPACCICIDQSESCRSSIDLQCYACVCWRPLPMHARPVVHMSRKHMACSRHSW